MIHQLITLSPVERVNRAVGSYPARRNVKDGQVIKAPEGHAYVPIEARPEYDPSTHRIERELTSDRDGWKIAALTPEEIAAMVPEPGGVTKLTLMRRLDDMGKWDSFKGLLTQLPPIAQDAWNLAQEVKSNDPILAQYGATIQATLQLTDEEYSTLLTP